MLVQAFVGKRQMDGPAAGPRELISRKHGEIASWLSYRMPSFNWFNPMNLLFYELTQVVGATNGNNIYIQLILRCP